MLTVVTMQVSAESYSPGLGASKAAWASAEVMASEADAVFPADNSQPARVVHIIKLKNKATIRLFTVLPLFEAVDSGQQKVFVIFGRVVEHFFKQRFKNPSDLGSCGNTCLNHIATGYGKVFYVHAVACFFDL